MQPISLELLTIMKERDVQKSGGKHIGDLEVIREEMKRRNIDQDTLDEFRKKVNFR